MRVYYNEFDPFAAAWLRELIAEGLIPAGDVDTRSIVEVQPDDLIGYDECHFFAGIGGWPLALQLAGWPADRPVWTGSCPCQPFSAAGKQRGESDARHLWPDFRRLIAERRPPTVFGEQVASRRGRAWLAAVRADLEALGYGVGAADLCAAGLGAPHIRQRLWLVADAERGAAERRRYNPGDTASGVEGETQERERIRTDLGPGGDAGALGHLHDPRREGNGSQPLLGRGERGGSESRATRPGATAEAVAQGDGLSTGLEGFAGDVRDGSEPGRFRADQTRPVTPAGGASGAGHPQGGGRGEFGNAARARGGRHTLCSGGAGHWSDILWIPCRDGKARPVPAESSLFPLAHGVPNRVGTLRGAGNAITPEAAAVFIGAYLECR